MKKTQTAQTYLHTDKEISDLLQEVKGLNLDASSFLMVLTGPNLSARKEFISRLNKEAGAFKEVDLSRLVTTNEEETYSNIDRLFIGETEKNLLFTGGDVLSGEYTGFTNSILRYATPQERYLLNKIRGSGKRIVLDLKNIENLTSALQRNAQAIIHFETPDSFISRLIWNLKQVRVHGSSFTNKRPAALIKED